LSFNSFLTRNKNSDLAWVCLVRNPVGNHGLALQISKDHTYVLKLD
jgi:hypothetical protein